MKYFYEQIV
jgi:hypothetical protein